MSSLLIKVLLQVVLVLGTLSFQAQAAEPRLLVNPAAVASPQVDWLARHEAYNGIAKAGGVNLLFVGDSITDAWRTTGRAIWAERYAPLKAANFGISGDRTEHILWRLQNGNLEGLSPKVIVLMIGTNNMWRDTAAQIGGGVAAIVNEIRSRLPHTKVLLLAILPRGDAANAPIRQKVASVNELLAKLDDGRRVFFLDIGKQFLLADGTLLREVMPDGLHPNAAGYQVWADAMGSKLAELLE